MRAHDDQEDFASAAMMRLIVTGLARQGMAVNIPPPTGARVPRASKRGVLEQVLEDHGPVAVLSICDALRDIPPEPLLRALTQARSIAELMERWHRLERFSHGRHTVDSEPMGGAGFRLTHRARDDGSAPTMAESLVVFGFLTVLAEILGAADVRLETGDGQPIRVNRTWYPPPDFSGPRRAVLSGRLDRQAATSRLSDVDDPVGEMRRRIVADPVRRWSVDGLASEAGMSARTMQRRLAEKSMSFSRLVSEARLEVAAEYLCDGEGPSLAAIGFLSGYSDHAHFARSFSRSVGTTPSAYRRDFQA